jgi:hypothetical protein
MILQMKINNNRLERMLLRQEVFTNCKQKSENSGCTNMMKTISRRVKLQALDMYLKSLIFAYILYV